jgi:hypothetical protein
VLFSVFRVGAVATQRRSEQAVHLSVSELATLRRTLRCWLASALAVLCLSAATVHAGDADRRRDAVDLLPSVPADAQLVVVIEDLGAAWDSPAIGTAISAIQAVTDLSGTLDAWSVLAKRLELPPDEAARRLLGRRFMLVSDPEGDADSWAIAMVVDRATAGLLRRNLDAVPRALRDGLPVLAIENNAFELVVQDRSSRRLTASIGRGLAADDAIVVLGPSSRSRVFDALLSSSLGIGGRGATMDAARPGRIARALPDGTDIVVVQGEAENDNAWFVLGAVLEGHAIRLNFLRQNPELATTRITSVKPWRLDVFDRAAEGGVLAIAEVGELTMPIRDLLERAIGEDLASKVTMPAHGTLGGRSMLLGFGSAEGPLDVVGVFETSGVVGASREMDRSVAATLRTVFPGHSFEDFGGLFPEAVRSVDLRAAIGDRSRAAIDLLWPERGPSVGWTVRASTEPGAGNGRGWAVLGLGSDRVGAVADALAGEVGDRRDQAAWPWVSVFDVRPRSLIAELADETVALPPIVRAFGAVERIRVQTLVARSDLLRGGGTIEFVRPNIDE